MADGAVGAIIEEVTLDEIWISAAPLLSHHYDEVAKFNDIAILKPDYARYKAAEAAGRFLALLGRLDGEVIGYSANFHAASLHYADLNVYQNDVIYVAPAHRRGRLGLELRRRTLLRVRERWGPGLMIWHAKEGTVWEKLLRRAGCEVLDVLLAERV
jgi:GNAT superfamily N-acetyltransferase